MTEAQREKEREYQRNYRRTHRKEASAATMKWQNKNPDKVDWIFKRYLKRKIDNMAAHYNPDDYPERDPDYFEV